MKRKGILALVLAAVLLLSACGTTVTEGNGDTPSAVSPDSPAVPENSQGAEDSAVSQSPAVTGTSAVSESPAASEDPAVSESPAASKDPSVSESPAVSEDPIGKENPAVTETPAPTQTPAAAPTPTSTPVPQGQKHIHSYVSKTVEPTEHTDGYVLHTCDCGEAYRDEFVRKLVPDDSGKHVCYNAVYQYVHPTATSKGYVWYKCECEWGYKVRYIDKLPQDTSGHDHFDQMTTHYVYPTNKTLGYEMEVCTCGYSYISHYVDKLPSTQSVEGTYTIRYSARGKQYQTTFAGELCQVKLEIDSDLNGCYEEGTNTFSLLTVKDETVLKNDLVFQSVEGSENEFRVAGTYYYTVYQDVVTAFAGSTLYDIFQYSAVGQFLMLTDVSIYDSKGNRVASTKDLLLTCDEASYGYMGNYVYVQDCDTLIATSDFEEPKAPPLYYEDAEDPANLLPGNFDRKPDGAVIRHSKLVQTGDTPEEIRDHFIDVMKQLVVGWSYNGKSGTYGVGAGTKYEVKGDQYVLTHFNGWYGVEDDNGLLNAMIYFGGEKMATAVWSMLYEHYICRSTWNVPLPISDRLAAKYGLTLDVLECERGTCLMDVTNGETTWRIWYVYNLWNNVKIYIPTGMGQETATPSNKPAPVPEGYGPIKLTRDFGMGNSTVTLSAAKETQTVLNIDGVQKTVRLITVARESTYDNEMFYHQMTKNTDGSYSKQGMNAYMGNEKRYVENLFVDSQGQQVDYVYLPYADVYLTRYSG